jgi:hypothetical protein
MSPTVQGHKNPLTPAIQNRPKRYYYSHSTGEETMDPNIEVTSLPIILVQRNKP